MKTVTLILPISLLLGGCNAVVADYVRSNAPEETGSPPPDATQKMGYILKVTPGKQNSLSSGMAQGSAQLKVTPSKRKFQVGSDMSANLTISQSRSKSE